MAEMSENERQLVDRMADLEKDEALALAKRMLLEEGAEPARVLELCRAAMGIVGEQFQAGGYSLPELMMAGEILDAIERVAEPLVRSGPGGGPKKLGKVLIGAVRGDRHDVGKNIVSFLLDVNGFEVKDIGVDAPPQAFIDAIEAFKPDIVALSGFLALSFDAMKETIAAFERAGLRRRFKIIIGGGQIDETARAYAGADAFGTDAVEAVASCRRWVGAGP